MVTTCMTVSNDLGRSKNVEENNNNNNSTRKKKGRNLSSFLDCLRRRPGFVLLLLPAALLASLYAVSSEEDYDFDPRYLFYNNDDDNERDLDSKGKRKRNIFEEEVREYFSFFFFPSLPSISDVGQVSSVEPEVSDTVQETFRPIHPSLREEGKVREMLVHATVDQDHPSEERHHRPLLGSRNRELFPSQVLLVGRVQRRETTEETQQEQQRRYLDRVSVFLFARVERNAKQVTRT